ncbi:MAG: LamG-like jellyroll fold domain-containing protein, partial [Saprospiraceae bacterium]
DYLQSAVAYNYPPRIQSFAPDHSTVEKGDTVTFYGKGIDQETKDLIYTFILPGVTKSGLEKTATWIAPDVVGTYEAKLIIEDENHQKDSAVITIDVVSEINLFPQITSLTPSSRYTQPGGTIHIIANVTDGNNDPINYAWSVNGGNINGTGSEIDWVAPNAEGIYTLQLNVSDGRGGTASANLKLFVYDISLDVHGDLIAWYPFAGNAKDISGHELNGIVFGARLVADSLGHPLEAYSFDGINDHIRVTNSTILNFGDGITISFFIQPGTIGDKERFIISHGSYQNRWKVSITPDKKVRWTLKNTTGVVRDLDSETILVENKIYHIAVTYNGRFMMIYINGRLESFAPFSGLINPSPVDLEIAQIMPDDPSYNFKGVLDEIKIYDYAQLPDSVAAESGVIITGIDGNQPNGDFKIAVFPNPALKSLTIELPLGIFVTPSITTITVFDASGKIELNAFLNEGPTTTLDISMLASGWHIIRIMSDGRTLIKTFITE